MANVNPLLLVGAVIGVVTALLVLAYALVKDKKETMDFERTMNDGEILRRLAGYAKPYWAKFVVVLFLMLFSIAYDIISPLIIGALEELVSGEFELPRLFAGVAVYAGVLVFSMASTTSRPSFCSASASASSPTCARTYSPTLSRCPTSS